MFAIKPADKNEHTSRTSVCDVKKTTGKYVIVIAIFKAHGPGMSSVDNF